jgi:hypothetical protein
MDINNIIMTTKEAQAMGIITLEDRKVAKKTLDEAVAMYCDDKLPNNEFACSAKEAFICKSILRGRGIPVQTEFEDGNGSFTVFPTKEMLYDEELTGYVSFYPVKSATFLKKDAHRATAWRLKMFESGYKWIENPYNPNGKVDYDHATRYYFDPFKMIFWVVDLGG